MASSFHPTLYAEIDECHIVLYNKVKLYTVDKMENVNKKEVETSINKLPLLVSYYPSEIMMICYNL